MSEFEGVADTLFIPLVARVYTSKRFPEFFYDPKALELEPSIPGTSIQESTNEYQMLASAARYQVFDDMVRGFIVKNSVCNVVNLGCGLETQYWRIGTEAPGVHFYEMDLPEVIDQRHQVLEETERETFVPGDLFDLSWADGIDTTLPTLMTASGVFQYFHVEDVLGFIANAKKVFSNAELIFDGTNTKGLKYTNRYVKKTGNDSALMYCGIDDIPAFAREAECELLDTRPFFTSARKMLRGQIGFYTKIAMKIADNTGRVYILHLKL